MITRTKDTFQHVALYGQTAQEAPNKPGPIPRDFTFNSLVGCCMDRLHRVWVCDTGNNRVLVLDKALGNIIAVLDAPAPHARGPGGIAFRMPFHVCQHPEKNQMYITDMGNSRVVVMAYAAEEISFSHVFGNTTSNRGAPLQDPNGITIVRHGKGKYFVHVNDEFFHTESDRLRNRCVRYTDQGVYVDEFRSVIDPDGTVHDIYWPQGLSSDQAGNLYLANTGSYAILKCPADAPVDAQYRIHAKKPVVMHRFGQPGGLGMMNIMRFVNAIGEHVFVPDHILNTISVYDLHGRLQTTLCGIRPSWNHSSDPVHSLSDPLYYSMENTSLLNPYVICPGENEHTYFVTEPFSSRLLKLDIPRLSGVTPPMTLLAALGARRNQTAEHGKNPKQPQFNCVTAVTGFRHPPPHPKEPAPAQDLPAWLSFNPFEQWYRAFSAVASYQYQYWFGDFANRLLHESPAGTKAHDLLLNMDAGNWRMKAYLDQNDDFSAVPGSTVDGYFLPGNLSMAVYYPKHALLGQICPQTPLLFAANFDLGTISMYQLGPNGKLLNYGAPFGMYGQLDGCMRGPQGMAVSEDGAIFIVDSLNNRIGKWQILQTGQVVFISNFVWHDKQSQRQPHQAQQAFTPTDVAIDAKGRVLVTDQFNNRICAFDLDGASLWCYGKEGYWEEGEPDGARFMLPTSIAVDGEFLVLNDLVNRALKLFRIEDRGLTFLGGISLFKLALHEGGVWMPFFMYTHDRQVYIADSTYNIVQVFKY